MLLPAPPLTDICPTKPSLHPVSCPMKMPCPCPALLQSALVAVVFQPAACFGFLAVSPLDLFPMTEIDQIEIDRNSIECSGFLAAPPLDLFLRLSQQPQLPVLRFHSQAPLPAPRMFMCSGLDVPAQALHSPFGMLPSRTRRTSCTTAVQRLGTELPSPTHSVAMLGAQSCAHGRGNMGDAP